MCTMCRLCPVVRVCAARSALSTDMVEVELGALQPKVDAVGSLPRSSVVSRAPPPRRDKGVMAQLMVPSRTCLFVRGFLRGGGGVRDTQPRLTIAHNHVRDLVCWPDVCGWGGCGAVACLRQLRRFINRARVAIRASNIVGDLVAQEKRVFHASRCRVCVLFV
jgi:hypothetical protein